MRIRGFSDFWSKAASSSTYNLLYNQHYPTPMPSVPELLAPAGSPEALKAAVAAGADAVYLGGKAFGARRYAANFDRAELSQAILYAHKNGVKVYVTVNTLATDDELPGIAEYLTFLSEIGVDAVLVQDQGILSIAREAVPDLPLHASTQMTIHNTAGIRFAAEHGISRVVLARELPLEDITAIGEVAKEYGIELEVFCHGAICYAYSGQCLLSSVIGGRSGNRGMCAQPCRMQYSLGGRMDDYPLSLKDNCLVSRLEELEEAGVACIKIEGRMKRPEYTAIVTGIYAKALREHRQPSAEEMELLEKAFSRNGFTQGYFNGDKQNMFGVRGDADPDTEKIFTEARKKYADGEMRRVPVHFYTVAEKGEHIRAIAFDDEGHKAVAYGPVPERARSLGLTDSYLEEQMFKTGGTPYNCVENKAKADPGLFLTASAVNELRRTLIARLSDDRARPPQRRKERIPLMPGNVQPIADPVKIFQVRTEDQLTAELAALKPDYIYVPATVMAESFDKVKQFTDLGAVPVAVLPRIVTDDQAKEVFAMLEKAFDCGVNEALVGNMGHVFMARGAGMKVRGDFGLNAFNSYTLGVLKDAGFLSATASFELRIAQIKAMHKPLDTELIVYGRLPLMVSDQCVMHESAGRCTCQTPGQLQGGFQGIAQSSFSPASFSAFSARKYERSRSKRSGAGSSRRTAIWNIVSRYSRGSSTPEESFSRVFTSVPFFSSQ